MYFQHFPEEVRPRTLISRNREDSRLYVARACLRLFGRLADTGITGAFFTDRERAKYCISHNGRKELDGLCGTRNARSPVEVSLEAAFEREYSSLHDAVDNFFVGSSPEQALTERRREAAKRLEIVAEVLPEPRKRPFRLFGIDTTPGLRAFAAKLADRGVVYHPNPAPGNKPIGVGHSDSVLASLPERETGDAPRVVPLSCERVPTDKTAREVAVARVAGLLANEQLAFANELTVEVVDSYYSRARYPGPTGGYDNHVVLARVARNRIFHCFAQVEGPPGRAHARAAVRCDRLSGVR